jgi:hypothetical protein
VDDTHAGRPTERANLDANLERFSHVKPLGRMEARPGNRNIHQADPRRWNFRAINVDKRVGGQSIAPELATLHEVLAGRSGKRDLDRGRFHRRRIDDSRLNFW